MTSAELLGLQLRGCIACVICLVDSGFQKNSFLIDLSVGYNLRHHSSSGSLAFWK